VVRIGDVAVGRRGGAGEWSSCRHRPMADGRGQAVRMAHRRAGEGRVADPWALLQSGRRRFEFYFKFK
jgi:hypothetical protein